MSHNKNQKYLKDRFKCSICKKGFMEEWAKNNHEKHCKEKRK
jgi:hypothetical protein